MATSTTSSRKSTKSTTTVESPSEAPEVQSGTDVQTEAPVASEAPSSPEDGAPEGCPKFGTPGAAVLMAFAGGTIEREPYDQSMPMVKAGEREHLPYRVQFTPRGGTLKASVSRLVTKGFLVKSDKFIEHYALTEKGIKAAAWLRG